MAIYIDKNLIPDPERMPAKVLEYAIREHSQQCTRWNKLYDYYMARNTVKSADKSAPPVVVSYARYIVKVILGYYLGDPVQYMQQQQDSGLTPGTVPAVVRGGRVVKFDGVLLPVDITPVIDCYESQTISDMDSEIGKNLGIFGESYELEYSGEDARPRTVVCDPRSCIMIRDCSVEHAKICFIRYERVNALNETYYHVFVYTDQSVTEYRTTGDREWDFYEIPGSKTPHYFGEVPAVEYQNGSDRLADFESVITLIDAICTVYTDRISDKEKFVDSILAIYGATLQDEDRENLVKYRMIDGIPVDARLEYVQKSLDESGVRVLVEDLAREIHKQSLTVDMTDQQFSGNSSGEALKLKLLTMSMLVKTKIRSMERGLKKRFEIYNRFLSLQGVMPVIDKRVIEPIFTVALPLDDTAAGNEPGGASEQDRSGAINDRAGGVTDEH